jgi:hypothetical protein
VFLAHVLLVAPDRGRTESVGESQVWVVYLELMGIRMAGYWRLVSVLGLAFCHHRDAIWTLDVIFQADQGYFPGAANLQKFSCPPFQEDWYQATRQKLLP